MSPEEARKQIDDMKREYDAKPPQERPEPTEEEKALHNREMAEFMA
jgi:hypothetical protein